MVTPREYEEARAFIKAKLASPREERERWLNEIIDNWIANRRKPQSARRNENED
jgi:hypothetical protein